jgi:protein TonB
VGWITNDDYPRAALVREWEGTLSYRLVVDSAGRVTGCSVTQSSGHRALDEAACRLVTRRARFEPASDATGAATGGSYAGVVTWSIPD